MKKGLLILVVLILVLVFGVAPWLTGYLFKKNYLDLIRIMNQNNPNMFTVTDYQNGWFSSDVSLQVKLLPEKMEKVQGHELPTMALEASGLTLKQYISHGPIVWNNYLPSIGLAYIHTVIHLSDLFESALFGKPKPEGIGSIDTIAQFDGTWHERLVINPITISPKDIVTLIWDGVKGDIDFTVDNNQIKNVQTNITFGRLSANSTPNSSFSRSFSMVLQPIMQVTNSTLQPIGLWTGDGHLSSAGLNINGNDRLIFGVDKFSLISKVSLNDNQYSLASTLSIQKIDVPDTIISMISPFNLQLALSNFDAAVIYQIVQLSQQTLDSDEFQKQLLQLLPSAVTQESFTQLDFFGTTALGGFNVKIMTNWPKNLPLPKTSDELYQNAYAKIDIRIASALESLLMNQVIAAMAAREASQIQRNPQQTPPPPPPSTVSPSVATTPTPATTDNKQQQEIFKIKIADLMQQGKLPLSSAIQIMTWFDQRLSPAEFTANLKQMNLLPDAETQLTQMYQQLYVQPPVQTQAATPALPATPPPAQAGQPTPPVDQAQLQQQLATAMKTQFDELLQQGYITLDNNDYVTSITYESGVFKVNGKPLPTELLGPSSGSTTPPVNSPPATAPQPAALPGALPAQ